MSPYHLFKKDFVFKDLAAVDPVDAYDMFDDMKDMLRKLARQIIPRTGAINETLLKRFIYYTLS